MRNDLVTGPVAASRSPKNTFWASLSVLEHFEVTRIGEELDPRIKMLNDLLQCGRQSHTGLVRTCPRALAAGTKCFEPFLPAAQISYS